MAFKDRSFMNPSFVDHYVGEDKLHFFPTSVRAAFQLRSLVEPVTDALAVLFSKSEQDRGSKQEAFKGRDELGHDSEMSKLEIDAINPDMAKYRDNQRREAINKLVTIILQPDSRVVLAQLIMDSLREEFNREEARNPKVAEQEFDDVPAEAFIELLVGLCKANKKVFGPFEKALSEVAERVKSTLAQTLKRQPDESSDENSSDDSSESATHSEPSEETSGKSSNEASSEFQESSTSPTGN